MTRDTLRDRIETLIRETTQQLHDATQWNDEYYRDAEGRTPRDRLVQRILTATETYQQLRSD